MTSPTAPEQRALLLPVGMATHGDLSRVLREVESVNDFLKAGAIRQPGSPMQLPKTSKLFEALVSGSKLNMLQESDREYLRTSLQWLRANAPVLHIAFSTDPSAIFLEQLMTWLRQHISPFVFLQVGLHPNLGAGCVVRTTNKDFDFSLRQRFFDQRELLMKQLLSAPALVVETATTKQKVTAQ